MNKQMQILYYKEVSMGEKLGLICGFLNIRDEISWTIRQNCSHRHDLARTGSLGTLTA